MSVSTAPSAGGTGATVTGVGNRDFGDAPDTATGTGAGNYQTLGSDNGPSHTVVSGLRLGAAVTDADGGTLQNAAANADDLNGTDDEDGVASFPVILTTASQPVTVPVTLTNTTGASATLVGYLDFNKNGVFGDTTAEVATATVANGATSASLNFTTPAGLAAGTTYARLRIAGSAAEVASPTGAASSGEVEDYGVVIGAPNLTIAKTHTPASFVRGGSGSYTLTVSNGGDQPTSGTLTVVDTLPSGLSVPAGTFTPGGTNGAAWSCAASGQTVTCTTAAGTVVAVGGSSAFSLNVSVAANAANPSVNNVSVSGGGEPAANTADNAAADSAPVLAPTNLTLTKADTGTFTVGGTGGYRFTVTNAGGVPSSGPVTVTDPLPTGLSFVAGSVTGAGWNCTADAATPQTVSCTSSAAIAASGSSTFGFSVTVGVATAVPTVTNTAAVVGGGDPTPSSAGDATTVLSPDLTLAKTHAPASFVQGGSGSYSVTVTNGGTAATSGPVTVTDTLPTGLTYAGSVTGAGWSCTASGQSVTCTRTAAVPATAGSNSSTLTFGVGVATTAAASVTNEARVSGGNEATLNDTPYSATTPSNTARDVTPTVDAGRLTLSKTVRNVTRNDPTGVTSSGEPGDVLEYCIGYANSGESTVRDTILKDSVPDYTVALLTPYAGGAVQWTVTAPTASSQTLSAGADADAGELGTLLTVRLGSVPPAGTGRVCFRVTIE